MDRASILIITLVGMILLLGVGLILRAGTVPSPAPPTPTATSIPTPIPTPTAIPSPTPQCLTYTYWVLNPADSNPWIQLAERQVCGVGLQDGPIVGPPRAALEAEITRLLNELDRWVDCVREKLCTPDMKPWWEVDNASKM